MTTTNDGWDEFFEGLRIAEEETNRRMELEAKKEYRIYYNADDGTILGMFPTDYPTGDNYIVIKDPVIFQELPIHRTTIVDGKINIQEPPPVKEPEFRLTKSSQGYCVVKGHAAIILNSNEIYKDIEYYDRKTNN